MIRDDYLIHDPPLRAILLLSWPMMLGNLFQQLYTMADSVIVGRFIGEDALASVGASYALTSVFIAVAIGGGAGATVLTSRAFGAGRMREMKESISTALISFLVLSIVMAVAGYMLSPAMMHAFNTPERIIEDAVLYLRIYFLGLPFLFMYNILSSVFNSLGKSSIPLCLLIFSSILNVALDIAAVAAMGMGVAGAAWATLISQAISALLSLIILLRVLEGMEGRIGTPFSPSLFRSMSAIAIPSVIQQSTISFGMMLVQSVVNGFGPEVLAGYSAAIRIDSLVTVPLGAVGNAMSPYTAQNIGAGRTDRIRKGYRIGLILIALSGIITLLILITLNTQIIGLFLGEEGTAAAYGTGEHYISFLCWFYTILGAALVTGGVLRGMGRMRLFALASIANLTFRVIGSMVLAPRFGVEVVWYVVPVGWSLYFGICYAAYRMKRRSAS